MTDGNLSVGFGEADITPDKPVQLHGYYYDRLSTGVHDPLFARAMAVSDGETRAALCVVDLCSLTQDVVRKVRRAVEETCGLSRECLMLSTQHTHTGPDLKRELAYAATLPDAIAQAVQAALDDLKPAAICATHGREETLQFIRRYRMKDGSVRTNPGILNPDVEKPIGAPDREVLTILVKDGGRTRGGIVNFGLHCDTVGGTEISADWTHYLREGVREELGQDISLLTPVACCGDINHWNVFREVTSRGFEETKRIGTTLAEAAVASLGNCVPVGPGPVHALRKTFSVDLRMPTEAELAAAKDIMAQPAPDGVDFTMDRVDARRKVTCAELGPALDLDVPVVTFGDVALVGLPTEFFTALGQSIKERSPFAHTVIVTLAGRNVGYIGESHNYDEGGYEMTSSIVVPGTGERVADTAIELLNRAREA